MPPPRPWDDEDDDATPYGLSKADALITGVSSALGRIRVTNDAVQVKCLAFAEREPLALVAAEDRVSIVDLKAKKRTGGLKGHDAPVSSGSISPDGATAVTGDRDGRVIVWDVAERQARWTHDIHDGTVTSLGLSPCGRYAVSGGTDGTVRLWRVKNGEEFELKRSRWQGPVRAVAFSPDGKDVLAGGEKVMLWDFETGGVDQRTDALPGGMGYVTFTPDGHHFAAAGAKEVRVFRWERETGHADLMLSVAPSQERQIFAATMAQGGEHLVTISSVVTAGPKHGGGLSGGEFVVAFLAVGVVGALIIDQAVKAGSSSGPTRTVAVEVWKIGNKERGCFFPIELPTKGRISMLASSKHKRLLVGTAEGVVELFAFL
jgi:hypothetical protein